MSARRAVPPAAGPPVFTCAQCGGTFLSDVSEAETVAEAAGRYPGVPVAKLSAVCDQCFRLLSILHALGIEVPRP